MFSLLKEIYPPKVHQFAYVTDGACTEDDILSMEIIIMKVDYHHFPSLHWRFLPKSVACL